MLVHAVVARLNRYSGDSAFENVMQEIQAANEEGLSDYEVDVNRLDSTCRMDIVVALEEMGYVVSYTAGDETLYVSND